jgi:eukaryotic-like serine/threonine-protein kinase
MGAVSVDQRAPVGPLASGAKLGRYEILGKLAAGGMAIVYVARVQSVAGFERLVAIKVLHANLAHEDEFIRMFLDEARLAASIRHPNVVPTIDISDSEEAGFFIVMEYIEGDHLGALLSSAHKAEEILPLPITLRIIADALGGLGAAHDLCDDSGKSLHLVHRDVSPHNIMVGRDGVVRLTDFGVAKAEDRLTHTRDGQVKGKLAYMAPEQAACGRTDLRSDLFSMGVILWECATGQRLFRAENTGATLHKLLHDVIPAPSSVDPQLAPLDALLGRALAREPAQRFQTAEEFAQAIEDVAPALGGLASLRGVARVVKHHTAAKLKREKKLIDDALRALRPDEYSREVAPELEVEDTNPSSAEISVSSGSLSASKVSGVFSHDTIPGTRRLTALKRDDPPSSAIRPMPPAPSGTLEAPQSHENGLLPRARPPAVASASVAVSPAARRPSSALLWVFSAVLLGSVAFWTLHPEREDVRVGIMPDAPLPASAAQIPSIEAPLEAAEPAPVQAAVDRVEAAQAKLPAASAPEAKSDTPIVQPALQAQEPPARLGVKREEPAGRVIRHPRRERVEAAQRSVSGTRSAPRTDVIPNPYHD